MKRATLKSVFFVATLALIACIARADVFHMPDGMTSLEFVPVGNAGNAPDTTGYGAVSSAYAIGQYEVTAGQYATFLNAVAKTDTYGLYNTAMSGSDGSRIFRSTVNGSYSYTVAAGFENRPVNYVSFWDSARFVNWLHNGQPIGAQGAGTTEGGAYTLSGYVGQDGRSIVKNANARYSIPTEDEWYKAAYHQNNGATADYYPYPTSSNSAPGNDPSDASGNNANISALLYTTDVGQFHASDSPYGTFDQGGNVSEWNSTVTSEDGFLSTRGVRGGSYDGGANYLSSSARYGFDPTLEASDLGFRVATVPEPGSLAMLAGLAAIGLLCLRRRRGRA